MRIPLGLRAAAGATQGGGGGGGGGGVAWDISTATFNGSPINFFSVADRENNPQGVFFKPDGTKMYITGATSDDVHEYNLSTAWSVKTASYVQTLIVGNNTTEIFFKSDGTKLYVLRNGDDVVYEYDLSTAWDLSTASFVQSFDVTTQENRTQGLFFKTDGTKMYVTGTAGDDVNEYDLSTAWDISTASYSQNFSVSAQEGNPNGVFFKSDGTRMYIIGDKGTLYQYNLSTAWDVSTASFSTSQSVPGFHSEILLGLYIKDDGTKLYTVANGTDMVFEHNFSTAWDISTITFTAPTSDLYGAGDQVLNFNGMTFKPDGTKMYLVDTSPDDISEYTLSTAWDITTASYVQAFDVSSEETNPYGVAFKTDGTKMYVIGTTGDDVNEYNLSTAWDVSTASYSQSFSVATEETAPNGLTFKPDGTKMYVIGIIGDDVNEYDLSTAWDVSTASYVQNFAVNGQDTAPRDVHFKPDGTKMYMIGSSSNTVYEYDLSTAWDISTASYLQSFDASDYGTLLTTLFFKPDGTKLYIADYNSSIVWSFDL